MLRCFIFLLVLCCLASSSVCAKEDPEIHYSPVPGIAYRLTINDDALGILVSINRYQRVPSREPLGDNARWLYSELTENSSRNSTK